MVKIIVLGSAHAVPAETHENTHLALLTGQRTVLIDSAGTPVVRLKKAGIDLSSITDLILTHFHPDHVAAVPQLLMGLWLLGRTELLRIYGLAHTLDRFEQMMELFNWKKWPGFFPVRFHRQPVDALQNLMEDPDIRIHTSLVRHLIPTLGLRIEDPRTGRSLAYSCDTKPCDEVVELAHDVDILLHEATGESDGHTSPAQAGEVARQASVKELYLIHYPPEALPESLLTEARSTFSGPVYLATDFLEINL